MHLISPSVSESRMSGESAEGRRGPDGVAGKRGRGSRERRRGILRIRYKKIQTYVSKLRKQSRWKRRWMGFINTQDRSTCAFCANAPNEREHLSLYLSLSLTVFSLSHHRETDRFWTWLLSRLLICSESAWITVCRTATCIEYLSVVVSA